MEIKITGGLLEYANPGDAGADLRATTDVILMPGDVQVVSTGLSIALPEGYAALVVPRSGLAAKDRVTVLNTPGLIDSGYRGEIKVILHNVGRVTQTYEVGTRIAQLVIIPVVQAKFINVSEFDASDATQRGTGGFGSTGLE